MSTYGPIHVRCSACGAPQLVLVPESANVQRQSYWRDYVLEGSFMRFTCETCGLPFVVERELLYTDLDGGLFVGVFPNHRRADYQACAETIEQAFARALGGEAPLAIRHEFRHVQPRVCFGYAELREKVVCFAAGLDDRVVEALKLTVMEGIPGAAESGVKNLILVDIGAEGALIFAQEMDRPMSPSDPLIQVDRAVYDDLARDRERIALLLPALFSSAYVQASSPALRS